MSNNFTDTPSDYTGKNTDIGVPSIHVVACLPAKDKELIKKILSTGELSYTVSLNSILIPLRYNNELEAFINLPNIKLDHLFMRCSEELFGNSVKKGAHIICGGSGQKIWAYYAPRKIGDSGKPSFKIKQSMKSVSALIKNQNELILKIQLHYLKIDNTSSVIIKSNNLWEKIFTTIEVNNEFTDIPYELIGFKNAINAAIQKANLQSNLLFYGTLKNSAKNNNERKRFTKELRKKKTN